MSIAIQMNSRGTLTIPAKVRKRFGLQKGGCVIAEESDGGIILRPGRFFPVEIYSDERLREFESDDKELSSFLSRKRKK